MIGEAMLLVATMLPAPAEATLALSADTIAVVAPAQPAPTLAPPGIALSASGGEAAKARKPLPRSLIFLVAEGSIAALSSSGHIADAFGQPFRWPL